jgi:hypothetical protein
MSATRRRRQPRAADVSHHAALRWLQRVDSREPRPAERVREAVERAEAYPERDDAVRDPRTGAILLLADDGGVRTVLREPRWSA